MIKVAHSVLLNPREAVNELRAQFGDLAPRIVLCFASSRHEPHELVRWLQHDYKDAAIVGGSTAGEMVSGKMLKGGVVAMAIGTDVVERVATVSIENLNGAMDLDAAFQSLERHMGQPLDELDPDTHVGIVIADGLSGAEERLVEGIAKRTDIAFVGGSAGDDLRFEKTRVFNGRNVLENAAVLAVLKVPRGFEILKTQSFEPTGKFLEATDVDEANRKVVSFGGHPAVYAYAEAVGALPDAIGESFMTHPLARMVGSEPFIRSPQKLEGTAIRFYCAVKKGEKLAVMKATDILADTRKSLEGSLATAKGVVDFHCILRALELESRGLTQDYGAIYKDVPMVGFCTYGEAWMAHINQTSTILVFK